MNAPVSKYPVSKYPVLVISFNNCEIHACHLDGFKNDWEALANRLKAIDEFFIKAPKNCGHRIWYNVGDSVLSDEVIADITGSLLKIEDRIVKIAFIGVKRKRRLNKSIRQALPNKPVSYFADAEAAKEWLI